jgi:ATPase subunit of ABC transporter with duplicated ATPase domains
MSTDRPPIISVHNLQKIYLERAILEDVSFTIHEGERVALLGANGAGKSTLLGIMAGEVTPEEGDIRLRRDLSIAYLHQEGGLKEEWTVREALESAFAHLRAIQTELDQVHLDLETKHDTPEVDQLLEQQSQLSHQLELHDYHTLESRMEEARRELGVPEEHRLICELSGGERRRTALCRILLEEADLLFLDEPTNHLDAESLDWLENFLARFRGTVVLITHDRYFLDNVTTKMIEVARGRALVYQGNYSDYLEAKRVESEHANRAEGTRQNLLKREMEWLRRQPRARTTKSQARIDRAMDLINSKPLPPDGNVQMLIPTGPRLGKQLIEVEDVCYAIGDNELIRNFTFILNKGDRIGVVGRNGLGKTTLLRLLMKQLEPDGGTITHGSSLKFVYADQNRQNLDPEKTVLEEVAGNMECVTIGDRRMNFRTWLGHFLFDDNTASMPIKLLSGGEQNRVQMAKLLREGGNVVVLDEPTNDLDLPTLRILEEALANFDGCAFVVSHDRYFLNRVANRIIAFQGDGQVVIVEGNYDHYRLYCRKMEEQKRQSAQVKKNTVAEETNPTRREQNAPEKKKKKLSYKEQREFDGLEEAIMKAETLVEKLEEKMQAPNLYSTSSGEEVTKLVADLEAAKTEVERLYDRWAKLSDRAK